MSSLTDVLTVAKNIVTALNQLGQTYLSVEGISLYSDISAPTVVLSGQGRIARIAVVTAGSTTGSVYDADDTAATTNKLWTIPTTTGITVLNLPVNNGILISPGTGQTVAVSYS